MTEAELIMSGMAFQTDLDLHEFIPCPGVAFEHCRVYRRKKEFEGNHLKDKKRQAGWN